MNKKKIFYWSPHINDQVATVKSVKNSIYSLKKFGEENYEVYLFNVFGEWDILNDEFKKINVKLISVCDFKVNGPIHGFIKSRLFYIFISLISLIKLPFILKKYNPDTIICHLIVFPILILSNFYHKKIKFILRVSGLPKLNLFRYFYWKYLSKKLHRVTCPTEKTREDLVKNSIFISEKVKLLEDPVFIIRNLFNNEDLKFKIDRKFILAVGRLTKQKKFELLIQAVEIISKRKPDMFVIIVGSGEQENLLNNLIAQRNLKGNVKIIPFTKSISSYYKNADFFISTALWEDPGFAILEAAMFNLTVLSSDCLNGPKEFTKGEIRALKFKNNNLQELVSKLNLILDHKISEENLKIKKINAKKYCKQFTIFSHYQKLKKIIN